MLDVACMTAPLLKRLRDRGDFEDQVASAAPDVHVAAAAILA